MTRPVRTLARVSIPLLVTILTLACQLTATPVAPTAAPAPLVQSAPTRPAPAQPPVPTAASAPTAEANPPQPTAKPALEHVVKGPFQMFTTGMGLPSGDLNDLWAAPDGQVWLAASSGVFSGSRGLWLLRLDQPADQILGADARGRVWVLLDEGARIAYNDATGWHIFDQAKGWDALPALEYPSAGFTAPPATDKLDQVWFATGRNQLRRFETKTSTWKVFTAEEIGYQPPQEAGYQGHFLTSAVTSSTGKVWVGDCIGEGEIMEGQGVRRLDGDTWNAAPPTIRECVLAMAADSRDRIWVGARDRVLRYDPLTGNWDDFPLPSGRSALVTSLVIDPVDTAWIEVARAGGASQFGAVQRFHLDDSRWVLDDDPGIYQPGAIAFDLHNQGWICSAGQVTLVGSAGAPLPFGGLNATACQIAFDESGQGWLLASGGQDAGLWWFSP